MEDEWYLVLQVKFVIDLMRWVEIDDFEILMRVWEKV